MKKRYPFFTENWFRFGLFTVFAVFCSLSLWAQTVPLKLWDKSFGGSSGEVLFSLQQTSDGGYILGGSSTSGISGDKSQPNNGVYTPDYWVVKLDVNGNKTWDKSIGGSDADVLYFLQQTSDGGYILGGKSISGIGGDKSQACQGSEDYWVVKLDASGNKIWDKTFGGGSNDELYSLQQTSDGGYILGGYSNSGISGDKSQASKGGHDYWVIKLDASGNKTWDKTIGGNNDDWLYSLQQTSDGGYILGGESNSSISGDKSQPNKGGAYFHDYWVVKLDASGNKTWDKTLGGNSNSYLSSLQQTSDGGYILGGFSDAGISGDKSQASQGSDDYWVVKLDGSGNKTWDKTFGGIALDRLFSLQQTSDGGYILGGISESGISGDKSQASQGFYDYWIVKLDIGGNKIWDKTFGGSSEDRLNSLKQTLDGGYILGGFSYSGISGDKTAPNKGNVDYWVIKLGPTCGELMATLTPSCSSSGTNLNLNIAGIQPGTAGSPSWTLTYTVNGVSQTVTGTTPTFTLVQNAAPGSVFSLVNIASGTCSTNLATSLTVQPIPTAPTVVPGSNCGAGSVTLSASGAPTGGSYVWYSTPAGGVALYTNPSGTFITSVLSTTTTYYVAARNNAGCESPRVAVTATIKPVLQFSLGANKEACEGDPVVLKTDKQPGIFLWSDGSADSTLTVYQSGEYWVKFMLNDCVTSDTIQVTFKKCPKLFIPNIITPNNDGKNDFFSPQFMLAGKWQLQIFNRWGVKLFESEDYQNNWPDKKIADGTYYYLLRNPETGQQYKGWVEVAQ